MKVDCPNLAVLRQREFENSPLTHISGRLTAYHVVRRNNDLGKYHLKLLQCFPSLKRHGFPTVGLCTLARSIFSRTFELGLTSGLDLASGGLGFSGGLGLASGLRLASGLGLSPFAPRHHCHLRCANSRSFSAKSRSSTLAGSIEVGRDDLNDGQRPSKHRAIIVIGGPERWTSFSGKLNRHQTVHTLHTKPVETWMSTSNPRRVPYPS